MGKGTYSGGGTIIRIGDEGTNWDSPDAAENKPPRTRISQDDNKRPTAKEIELEEKRESQAGESQAERKFLRNFISQCASAHATDKLTASNPIASKQLRKRVKNAGGNIKWLESNSTYQILFHEAFCRLRNENVPFEKVWGPRGS